MTRRSLHVRNSIIALGVMGAVFVGATGEKIGCSTGGGATNGTHDPGHTKRVRDHYPCGIPDPSNPDTWEYTVTTAPTRSDPDGRVIIICGQKKAHNWKRAHDRDTVRRTA